MNGLIKKVVLMSLIAGCLLIDGNIFMAIYAAVTDVTMKWDLFIIIKIFAVVVMIAPLIIVHRKGWLE